MVSGAVPRGLWCFTAMLGAQVWEYEMEWATTRECIWPVGGGRLENFLAQSNIISLLFNLFSISYEYILYMYILIKIVKNNMYSVE